MTLNPISIATKGYICDGCPRPIAIATKGYVCIEALGGGGAAPLAFMARLRQEDEDVLAIIISAVEVIH